LVMTVGRGGSAPAAAPLAAASHSLMAMATTALGTRPVETEFLV
jgi:hypothetical protein